MFDGRVEGIYIAPMAGAKPHPVDEVKAEAGRGLVGDRYYLATGTYSDRPDPSREVTLIEAEAVEAIRAEEGIEIEPGDTRRNVVTRGVPLNHLVGRDFAVGGARLHGVRLCEPCNHLSELNGVGLVKPLLHRAGLRARIVDGGIIRVGDAVREA